MKALIILLYAASTLLGQESGSRKSEVGSRGQGRSHSLLINSHGGPDFGGRRGEGPLIRPSHRFADRTNIILTVAHAGLRIGDIITTRRLLELGGHENLWPRAVVNSTPAFIACSAAEVVGTALLMYAAHRTGHHRIERALGWIQVGFMSETVINNAYVIRHQHRLGW